MKKIILRFRTVDKNSFKEIKDGLKTVETRAATKRYKDIKKGDLLVITCGKNRVVRKVKRVYRFKSIESMIRAIPFKKIMPSVHSITEMCKVYYSYPGYKEKIRYFGLIALEI